VASDGHYSRGVRARARVCVCMYARVLYIVAVIIYTEVGEWVGGWRT